MNTLNSKTNESNKFVYLFRDKLNLKNSNENMALANLSIYYTWKNIKSEYNNNNIQFLTYRIILNISSKNTKLLQIILLYKFM